MLDAGFIDNTELRFGDVDAVVTDASLITQMDSALYADGAVGRWKLLKIFGFLTTEPVTLTSKSGHPVPLPTLWTALILVLETEGATDEQALVEELNKLDGIVYAQVNAVATGDTNDPLYGLQHSLWDSPSTTDYDDANINVEGAWDEGVKGSDEIIVAVFDSGIDFRHEDFGYDAGPGYGSSVVNGGWCFLPGIPGIPYSPLSELEVPDVLGHGTNGAGIIGAISNNEIGVAGIAGGDAGNNIPGVRLQGMMIINSGNQAYIDFINPAIVYSLINSVPLFDIANHSWGFDEIQDNPNPFPLLREVFRLSYEMGVINVCSRGNDGDNEKDYPSSFRDDWAFSVGASGTDGLKADGAANDGIEVGTPHWSSSFGDDMDFVAPGAFLTIKTTGTLNQDEYTGHSGTSAAAPHASGVAALVLERLKTNYDDFIPSVEDVEHYIEYGVTDIIGTIANYPVGYEDFHGWGRLNAGAAIDLVDSYKPVHISINPTYVTESVDNFSTAFAYNYNDNYKGIEDMNPTYTISDYKIYTADININVCEDENELSTGATLADLDIEQKHPYWLRNAYTYLWGPPGTDNTGYDWLLLPENHTSITNPAISEDRCIFTAQLQGYEYIIYDANLEEYESLPIVPEGESRKFEFTLLVSDPQDYFGNEVILTGNKTSVISTPTITLIPNPAFEKIRIKRDIYSGTIIKARITNVCGQVLIPDFLINSSTEVEVGMLPSGIYFFVYESEGVKSVLKFIKL